MPKVSRDTQKAICAEAQSSECQERNVEGGGWEVESHESIAKGKRDGSGRFEVRGSGSVVPCPSLSLRSLAYGRQPGRARHEAVSGIMRLNEHSWLDRPGCPIRSSSRTARQCESQVHTLGSTETPDLHPFFVGPPWSCKVFNCAAHLV